MNGMAGMMGYRLLGRMIGCSQTRQVMPMASATIMFPQAGAFPPLATSPKTRRSAVRGLVPGDHHGTKEVDAVITPQNAWPFSTDVLTRSAPRTAVLGRLADAFKRHGRPRSACLFSVDDAICRTSVAFDIVAFGARCRDDEVQVFVHRSLYHILELAFDHAGVDWASSYREDRGDGALIIVPDGTPRAALVGRLVAELAGCLRQYNKLVADAAQIRLRMAVHTGPIYADANGLVGSSLVHLFRMLDAPAFKRAVVTSGADLGVVTSERLYRDVIEPAEAFRSLGPYRQIEVVLKETRSPAWVSVLGCPREVAVSEPVGA